MEVGMILGGWGIERPLLIRSDGIICSNQDSEEDDEINMMPKYPQVRLRFLCKTKIHNPLLQYDILSVSIFWS